MNYEYEMLWHNTKNIFLEQIRDYIKNFEKNEQMLCLNMEETIKSFMIDFIHYFYFFDHPLYYEDNHIVKCKLEQQSKLCLYKWCFILSIYNEETKEKIKNIIDSLKEAKYNQHYDNDINIYDGFFYKESDVCETLENLEYEEGYDSFFDPEYSDSWTEDKYELFKEFFIESIVRELFFIDKILESPKEPEMYLSRGLNEENLKKYNEATKFIFSINILELLSKCSGVCGSFLENHNIILLQKFNIIKESIEQDKIGGNYLIGFIKILTFMENVLLSKSGPSKGGILKKEICGFWETMDASYDYILKKDKIKLFDEISEILKFLGFNEHKSVDRFIEFIILLNKLRSTIDLILLDKESNVEHFNEKEIEKSKKIYINDLDFKDLCLKFNKDDAKKIIDFRPIKNKIQLMSLLNKKPHEIDKMDLDDICFEKQKEVAESKKVDILSSMVKNNFVLEN